MATKIVTKNSSTAGAAPTATDLVQGELAVNVADGRLYTEDNAAAIVELGVNPATEITANAGIALPDSQKATFGAGDDLQIYHDGSNSVIKDAGTGNLKVLVEDLRINNSSDTAAILSGDRGGAVTLYNNGSPKIATTSTGIDVTGSVTADGAVNSTYFTGGSSSVAGRQLTLSSEANGVQDNAIHRLTVPSGYGTFNVSVGGSERLVVNTTGIDVTGSVVADGLVSSGDITLEFAGVNSDPAGARYLTFDNTDTTLVAGQPLGGINWEAHETYTGINASIKAYAAGNGGEAELRIYTGQETEAMRITNAGNVGIGTSSPSKGLHLNFSNDSAAIRFQNTANDKVWDLTPSIPDVANSGFSLHNVTDNTVALHVDNSNNVGIGTSSPAAPLSIEGSSTGEYDALILRNSNAAASGQSATMIFEVSAGTSGTESSSVAKIAGLRTGGGSTGALLFHTTNAGVSAEAMRIDSSGNVGIGVSPSAKLSLPAQASGDSGVARFAIESAVDSNDFTIAQYEDGSGTYTQIGQNISLTSGGNVDVLDSSHRTAGITFDGRNNGSLLFQTGAANANEERMRIDSSGNVGVGVVPETDWETNHRAVQMGMSTSVFGRSTARQGGLLNNARITGSDYTTAKRIATGESTGYVQSSTGHDFLVAPSGTADATITWTPAVRIDSSGNLLVGTSQANPTSAGVNVAGQAFSTTGGVRSTVASNAAATFNRKTDDGAVVLFRKNGTTVGSIGTYSGTLAINSFNTGIMLDDTNDVLRPTNASGGSRDAIISLGTSSQRFKDIYRSGSTYSTSDRNMKQDIRELTDAERNVAVACKGLLKAFRFIDAVEKDGGGANIHFGVIAQELAEAFEAEGLDANDYQVYKSATTTDEDGNEQTRLNVCYENLLAFIIAAI